MKAYLAAISAALLLSAGTLLFLRGTGAFPTFAWSSASLLASLNAAATAMLNRSALKTGGHNRFIRRMIGHAVRVTFLFSLVIFALFSKMADFNAFFGTLMAGYFLLLAAEIGELQRRGSAG